MTLAPEQTDVAAIVEQVWSSFLGEEQPLLPALIDPQTPFSAPSSWSSAVSTAGTWNAIITVEISAALAATLTRLMLALPDSVDQPSDEDVADAVGELVNMIGGNVKSLMPGPNTLSLPAVAAGRAAHPHGAVEVARFDGVWTGEPVRVSVHLLPTT